MSNIRLYTLIFGFVFVFRILALGPWIREPVFSPFQLVFYSVLLDKPLHYPLEEGQSAVLAREVFGVRVVLWLKEIIIDGISWLGMVGLTLRKQFLGKNVWRVWMILCALWQVGITLWLSVDLPMGVIGFLLSLAAPYLLWLYGWQRQWLVEKDT
ncbi:MAG: hypothetical protein N2314_03485 [Brevinematales bacterium]|nr:hypothetical protein [Brevinematales bacterium]